MFRLNEYPLTNTFKNHLNGPLFQVQISETYFHPRLESYILSVKVEYRMGQKTTKREIKNIHESVRAHAAHNFNLTLRL